MAHPEHGHTALRAGREYGVGCKICQSRATPFDVVDFNKYCTQEDFYSFGFSGITVDYWRCTVCGCIFTRFFDGWSTEDFAAKVYNDDYSKVDSEYAQVRPLRTARTMAREWGDCQHARVLDYGSGAGVFAAELRRLGYRHVQAYDPFSSPARPQGTFDIVTCFEVIEHSPDPLATMRDMCGYLEPDGCILVGQTLQPPDIARLRGGWWYLAPRNGHICFYTANTMACMAERCGLTFRLGPGPYAFTRATLSEHARRATAGRGDAYYFAPLFAPASDSQAAAVPGAGWHEAETSPHGTFRWTASRSLHWPAPKMPHLPATLSLLLPTIGHLGPAMLQDSRARFGPAAAPFTRQGTDMVATLTVTRPATAIELHTPALTTPRAVEGSDDDRLLGLAVLTDSGTPGTFAARLAAPL